MSALMTSCILDAKRACLRTLARRHGEGWDPSHPLFGESRRWARIQAREALSRYRSLLARNET